MSFFTTKPEELSDEALDAIAEDAELKKAALAEREKRIEARRLAAEAEAREKAEAEKQATVDRLRAEYAAISAEAVKVNGAVGAAVIGLAAALEKRNALVDEARRIAAGLRALGVATPPLSLAFPPEVHAAARAVSRTIEEMVEGPLADAVRNSPSAFVR